MTAAAGLTVVGFEAETAVARAEELAAELAAAQTVAVIAVVVMLATAVAVTRAVTWVASKAVVSRFLATLWKEASPAEEAPATP